MNDFFLATANPHKAREISKILGDSVTLLARPPSIPDIDETGETLTENARIKARAIVRETGQAAIADDTGLEVDALGGAPGVYSARYAGEESTYQDNVAKLLRELASVSEPRTARFRTVAIVVCPDGREVVAEGFVLGRIATEPRGEAGFGYDPIFIPLEGDGRTFAEMTPEEKNRMSHRGAAFKLLRDLLQEVADRP